MQQFRASPHFDSPVGPDVSEYWAWSGDILHGKWLWDSVPLHAPLYAFVLAGERAIVGDSFFALRLLQLLMGFVAQVLVGWAAWRRFGPGVAIATAALWMLHLPLLFYDGQFYAEGLLTLLLSGVLTLTLDEKRAFSERRAALVGLLLGLAAITHPRAQVFGAGILGWIFIRAWRSARSITEVESATPKSTMPSPQRTRWLGPVLAVIALLLPIAPVVAYNSHLAGSFSLIQRHEGLNLYLGNNPAADGTPYARVGPEWDRLVSRPRIEGGATTDAARTAWYEARVWEFITQSPLAWLKLEARKLALTYSAHEITASAPYDTLAHDIPLLRLPLGFGLLLPFALVGLVAGGWRNWPLIWLILSTTASSVIFTAAGRYRLEMLPALFITGGFGIVWIIDLLRNHHGPRRHRLLAAMSALCVGVALTLRAPASDPAADQAEGAYLRGMAWLLKQDRGLAELQFRQALGIKPDDVKSLQVRGEVLEDAGRADEGLALVRRSVELDSRWPRSLDRLSAMLGRRGDRAGMMQYARAALAADPLTANARFRLANALCEDHQYDDAAAEFRALLTSPQPPEVYLAFANCLHQGGREQELVALLREAVKSHPRSDVLLIRLARVLAASPDAAARQPEEALHLAEHAVTLVATERRAEALDVLAMAQAASGKYDEAIATAAKALVAVTNPQLAQVINVRIQMYQQHRPYVEPR